MLQIFTDLYKIKHAEAYTCTELHCAFFYNIDGINSTPIELKKPPRKNTTTAMIFSLSTLQSQLNFYFHTIEFWVFSSMQ